MSEVEEDMLIPFGIYSQLIEDIKQYDNVQTTYRVFTSTLLLGTLAAIGFLFSLQPSLIPLNVIVWVIGLSVTTLAIITSFASLDLIFQERLMIANVIEVLHLEAKYSMLPKIHHNMLNMRSHPASPNKKVLFYSGCGICLIFIIGFSVWYGANCSLGLKGLIILSATVITMFLYGLMLDKFTMSFEELIKDSFDPSQYEKMDL